MEATLTSNYKRFILSDLSYKLMIFTFVYSLHGYAGLKNKEKSSTLKVLFRFVYGY